MGLDYKKEFFDRNYSAREAYSRAWGYARKYKFRIFVGIICGILTAGTLVPLFQVIQPAMQQASANEHDALKAEEEVSSAAPAPQRGRQSHSSRASSGRT